MKQIILFLMALVAILFVPTISMAQDKLTRVESRDFTRRAADAELSFHDQEMERLLIPKETELGVLCVPSFTPEWAITLDAKAHALVLKESEENIWYHKRGFDHWHEYTHKKGEKRPKQYKSPKVKTYKLTIAADMVPLLNAIWKGAIGTAGEKDRNVFMVDGTNWKYFINGEQAESRFEKNPLVAFTNELKQAIIAGNRSQAESLIGAEFQRAVSNLNPVVNIQ
jgi:hypothetical protein